MPFNEVNNYANYSQCHKSTANIDPNPCTTISKGSDDCLRQSIRLGEKGLCVAHPEWRFGTMACIWKLASQAVAVTALKTDGNWHRTFTGVGHRIQRDDLLCSLQNASVSRVGGFNRLVDAISTAVGLDSMDVIKGMDCRQGITQGAILLSVSKHRHQLGETHKVSPTLLQASCILSLHSV